MLTLSNSLTLLRMPAAFLFIVDNMVVRIFAIVLAMLSDILDGYFARKNKTESEIGAILDPIMDKFFMFFCLGLLVATDYMPLWGMACMISREVFLFSFGLYITIAKEWDNLKFHSIIWGKLTTVAQFIVLILIVIEVYLPWYVYAAFIPLGFLTAYALYRNFKKTSKP